MGKLRKIYSHILNNHFIKSIITLSSGVILGQAINFIGMPVIGRLYAPEDIGDYTSITANAGVISAIACLGMMTVFMLPEKDEEARALSKFVSKSTIFITTLIVFLLWITQNLFRAYYISTISYNMSLIVLWFYIVFYNISNICYAYVNRQKLYKVLFWNPIIAATINIVAGIILGLLNAGFLGYVFAHILSFAANILHLLRHANAFAQIDKKLYNNKMIIKEYKQFPIFQMPANLVSSLRTQIETQTIASIFSSTSLGMYSMAMRILSLPVSLLATPINRVYYQEANQRYISGEDIGNFSFNILKTNIKIAMIPIALVIIFGEWIFAVFLGEQWREAGTFAAIMAIYQLMNFCAGCLSGGFIIIKKNHINLAISVYYLISSAITFAISYYFITSVYLSLCLMCFFGISGVIVSQGIFFKLTGVTWHKYCKFILVYILMPVFIFWCIRLMLW